MSDVQVRIRIDDDADLEAAQALTGEDGVSVEASGGDPDPGDTGGELEPVTTILEASFAIGSVATFDRSWWEVRGGRLVLDRRPGAEDAIHRDREVPHGLIVVLAADGAAERIDARAVPEDAMERLLKTTLGGALETVGELVETAGRGGAEAGPA